MPGAGAGAWNLSSGSTALAWSKGLYKIPGLVAEFYRGGSKASDAVARDATELGKACWRAFSARWQYSSWSNPSAKCCSEAFLCFSIRGSLSRLDRQSVQLFPCQQFDQIHTKESNLLDDNSELASKLPTVRRLSITQTRGCEHFVSLAHQAFQNRHELQYTVQPK